MQQKKMKLCFILLLGLGLTGLRAQTGFPASGSNASGSGGTVSYSVGQVFYTTKGTPGSTSTAAEGVQQPWEISVVTGIEEASGITLQCTVSPNPTADFVNLKVDNYKTENLTYQLYDISGKLLENEKVQGSQTVISMKALAVATYFLKVTDNNKEVKTFKIIKH
jgi:hypothetical protein